MTSRFALINCPRAAPSCLNWDALDLYTSARTKDRTSLLATSHLPPFSFLPRSPSLPQYVLSSLRDIPSQLFRPPNVLLHTTPTRPLTFTDYTVATSLGLKRLTPSPYALSRPRDTTVAILPGSRHLLTSGRLLTSTRYTDLIIS